MVSKIIKKILLFLNKNNIFRKLFSFIKKIDNFETVDVNNKEIFILDKNYTTNYRIKTFFSKEPETLIWIDKFKNKSVFWDIGANIGLYSLYSQFLNKEIEVISFEPSILNLPSLIKNIHKNKLENNISVITNPIYNNSLINKFNLSDIEEGAANSNFNSTELANSTKLSYKTNSLDFKNIKEIYDMKTPDYVKIDVDGNEFQILESLLSNYQTIKSILIEVNKNADKIEAILKDKNFQNTFKKHGRSNQIWEKT